ncbi:hypothetical protein H6P81_006073 [Aristolochia fimbriata]|uniref:Zinc finger PHD-type domain-containing protein n=1 Tax=Aristolochia fimbriata TaxID=158543 RepID=A0AAV7EXG3_ARIFI|nr:hypothetical protein H6P81_006073 [Aristolochia fimbriata]
MGKRRRREDEEGKKKKRLLLSYKRRREEKIERKKSSRKLGKEEVMESSDDEEEIVPQFVNNYHFVDHEGEPICFSVLPLKLGEEETSYDSPKQIIAWKVLFEERPEISVLSKDKCWIKLQKPRKSFEDTIRGILITIRCVDFLKRNPETSANALWDNLKKGFSSYDCEPSKRDLLKLIMKAFAEKDEALGKSKLLRLLLEEAGKRNPSDQGFLAVHDAKKFTFIVDDDNDDDDYDDNDNDVYGDGSDKDKDELFDTVCAICDNGGKILCCEGKCMRSFHPILSKDCQGLGLTEAEVEDLKFKQFLCPNCLHKKHQCFACGRLGSSDKEANPEVFPCVSATCGYFYHPECVAKLLHPGNETEMEDLKNKISFGESFICPVHKCCICKHGEDKEVKELQFAVCRRCPKAYHRKCLPRKISFEDECEDDSDVRAWDDLIPYRILIYCLKHAIDPDLGTPKRNHIIFPEVLQKKETTVSVKRKILAKKKRKSPSEDHLEQKSAKRANEATEIVQFAVKSKKLVPEESFRKAQNSGSFKEIAKGGISKPNPSTASKSRSKPNKELKVEEPTVVVLKDRLKSEAMFTSPTNTTKKKPSVLSLATNEELTAKILGIMKKASFLTLTDIYNKHKKPSAQYHSSHNIDKIISVAKVECSVEALRTALKKLEEGATLEDAKAVCEARVIKQVVKWKNKLQVYLSPFLHGMCYTSYGRHFTKVDKLKEIVEKLHFYIQSGDMIVDFCCGANDFSRLMKEKLDVAGKKCFFKNYDFIQPPNDFCFEKRDWMTVKKHELPTGSQLIMGLNPPFGVRAALANKFIDKALEFKPKLLILIAPEETQRLDQKDLAYDLIWEDDCALSGKSFYLPGSIDGYDKQMEQWNDKPPLLYLWSRPDWSAKHRNIAMQWGHTSQVSEGRAFENGHCNPVTCDPGGQSDDPAEQLVVKSSVIPENKDPLSPLAMEPRKHKTASPEYSKDSTHRSCERRKEVEQREDWQRGHEFSEEKEQKDEKAKARYHESPREEQRIEKSRSEKHLKQTEKRHEKSGPENLRERKQRGGKRSNENLKQLEMREEKKLKVTPKISGSGGIIGSPYNRSDCPIFSDASVLLDVLEERAIVSEPSGGSHSISASVAGSAHPFDHDNLDEITRRYSVTDEKTYTGVSVARQSYRHPGIGGVSLDQSGVPLSNFGTRDNGNLGHMSYTEIEERQRREHDIRMQLRMYGQPSFDESSQRRRHIFGHDGGLPLSYGHASLPTGLSRLNSACPQNYVMHPAENYSAAPGSMREPMLHFRRNNIYNTHGVQVGYRTDDLGFAPGPRHPFPPPHRGPSGWID